MTDESKTALIVSMVFAAATIDNSWITAAFAAIFAFIYLIR